MFTSYMTPEETRDALHLRSVEDAITIVTKHAAANHMQALITFMPDGVVYNGKLVRSVAECGSCYPKLLSRGG